MQAWGSARRLDGKGRRVDRQSLLPRSRDFKTDRAVWIGGQRCRQRGRGCPETQQSGWAVASGSKGLGRPHFL